MAKMPTRATFSGASLSGAALKAALTALWDAFNSGGLTDAARTAVTSTSTLTTGQCGLLMVDATSGSIVLTLPTSGVGTDDARYTIRRLDSTANTVTVQRGGTDTIDGATSFTIGALQAVELQMPAGGTVWRITTISGSTAAAARAAIGSATLIQPITASVASNALTLTLNPTTLDFRSSALTSGAVNTRSVPSAISVVVPSTATLGTASGSSLLHRLAVLAIDYAGTVELAVANISQGMWLDEADLITTTTISAGANSASVAYSTTGRTSVPFRIVGFVDIAEATAGTWASAPTVIQGAGGAASLRPRMRFASTTASGTAVDFTNIPSWVDRITLTFSNGFSTNDATGSLVVQIGTGSSPVTSGYPSSASVAAAATNAVTSITTTTGFVVRTTTAADSGTFVMVLTRVSGNIWNSSHFGQMGGWGVNGGGYYSLSGPLGIVRCTVSSGWTFDGGTISILME